MTISSDIAQAAQQQALSVSALNSQAKFLLEEAFAVVYVRGEISNFTIPRSGHWYFTLKDGSAQVRCAMFKGANRYCQQPPQDGDEVIVRAKVSLYEGRGDYQLIVGQLSLSGEGALQRAFEALKQRLAQEGLFAQTRKKPLPDFPETIAIVTSLTGAAIRDVLTTLSRRYPLAKVYVIPTLVQGAQAAPEIVKALQTADKSDADVIILCRGGGSLEDLWAFNEESVALAIANADLPIICGVGHETDITIADYVADQRAATPTAAAELATPTVEGIAEQLAALHQRQYRCMERKLEWCRLRLDGLSSRLLHPGERLQRQAQRLRNAYHRLEKAIGVRMQSARFTLASNFQVLEATSPLATLGRGYALIQKENGALVKDAKQLAPGEAIRCQCAKGTFTAQVLTTEAD